MLPSNATSIRADISEGFSCENRDYGYYADVANECQIFHVCLPVMFNQRKSRTYQWSFICPEETVFSQDCFTHSLGLSLSEVIYYEHAQHQHHYDDHGDEYGGGYWKRSLEAPGSVASETEVHELPYRYQRPTSSVYHQPQAPPYLY
uniref:Chitin-binding type-2 domain-containing protein n=1 Tax=Phlebotomus papatasi TaxID=29031 RepID=A0A1B0D292_PHLPP